MAENKLTDLSMDFAVQTLQLCETIHSHSALVNQLERSSPSIGANIREASYAHGKADFIAKLQIALKECYETEYWLELFQRAGIADLDSIDPLRRASGTIRRMLIASVNTVGGFSFCALSRPWCTQPRGQLPAGQTAHERVKTVGTYRQPAAHARPQIRLGPRRQRRKTHLASPHPHSSLPTAKLLCIWITFDLSLYSLE